MTDYLHLLWQIFLILVQIAGAISLVLVIVLAVMLKRGYSFEAFYTNEEDKEQ